MKKIINNYEDIVPEMCQGMVLTYPELVWDKEYNIISRRKLRKDKVTLISGGGSGHEPAHGGFVGEGMLDAAVCGDIFASPSQIQVYQAIKKTAGDKGVLLIIKNYSGDMMNFKNGAYLAEEDGIQVEYVKVADDIAVQDSLYTVGRRGVAGTVFVHKIAGAAAERGYTLEQVKQAAQKTADSVKSLGFAFSSCVVPAKGTPTFLLKEDEMEYGVGIHGEPGIRREKILSADQLGKRMVKELTRELGIKKDEKYRTALLVNGLGGTPLQELYILNRAVRQALEEEGAEVLYNLTGNYMTSIDMCGASVSILKLDQELEKLFRESCSTPALKIAEPERSVSFRCLKENKRTENPELTGTVLHASPIIDNERIKMENITYILQCMTECIIKNEKKFCDMDSFAGDGDFGMSVAKGFRKLKEKWPVILQEHCSGIGELLETCGFIIMEYCGGASGPIWGSAFRMAGKAAGDRKILTKREFADLLGEAVKGIQKTGERSFGRGAVIGDKTLIDALIPCRDVWEKTGDTQDSVVDTFRMGAQAAVEGAEATEQIVARMGRAGTVGERSLGHPDAGAYALGVIFTDIAEKLEAANRR